MKDVHAQQIHSLLVQSGGEVTAEIKKLVSDQFSGIMHSEIVEDCIRKLRAGEANKGFNKKLGNLRAYLFHEFFESKS